jgi:hypothetical protein
LFLHNYMDLISCPPFYYHKPEKIKKYEVFSNKSLLDIHPKAFTYIRYIEGCPDDDNS